MLHTWETNDPRVKCAHIDAIIFVCSKLKVDVMANYSKHVLSILSRELLSTNRKVVTSVLSLWLKQKADPCVEEDSRHAVGYMNDNIKRIAELH